MTIREHRFSLWFFVFLSIPLSRPAAFAQSAPNITQQPQSQSLRAGTNATFTVSATGQSPLIYRWTFNGATLTNNLHIGGATNSALTISNIVPADAGNYQVIITNHHGGATSSIAALTVLLPPGITTQPTNVSIVLNSNVTFAAAASGTAPLSYRWYFNGSPLTNSARVSGSTNARLNISTVQTNDAGSYRLAVTNAYGVITSAVAVLTVLLPPAITTPPASQVALLGASAFFSVAGTGTPPVGYQWQKDGINLVSGGHIIIVSNSTLAIPSVQMSDAGAYQAVLTNAYGAVTSAPAMLSVVPLAAWGDNAYGELNIPLSLTNVTAIATEGYLVEYLTLALSSDSTVAGWEYAYGNTNVGIPAGLSNVVAVSAGYRHGLALENDGSVVAFGDNSFGETTLPTGLSNVVSVAAGGDYSLALKNDGTVTGWGYNALGEASPPAGLSNVLAIAAGDFHALAIKADGTITGWGNNPYGQASSPAGLSNVVAVSAGGHHSLALKDDGTVFGWGYNYYGEATIPDGLSNVVAIAAGFYHSLALKSDGTVVAWGNNDSGQATTPAGLSNVVAIAAGNNHSLAMVQNPIAKILPAITWSGPPARIVPSGQTSVFLPEVTGSLPLSFHWYFNGALLPGQTNQWLVVPSIQPEQAGNYQFSASNNYGSVTSQVAAVFESPGFVSQPASQSVLVSSNASFAATVIGPEPVSFQWYFNGTPLADNGRVSGSTTTNLSISNIQTNDAGSYLLVATNAFGSTSSTAATLTPLVPAAIILQPVGQTVLLSSNVSLAVSAIGTAPLSFHWYSNGAPLSDGGRFSGTATTNLLISNAQTNDSADYTVVVTNNYAAVTSLVATLTVVIPATITAQPASQSVLLSSNATFSATVNGTEPLNYQWYFNGAPLSDGGRISGSITATLLISNVQSNDSGPYQLIVTNNFGSAPSAVATLTVLVPAVIITQPTNQIGYAGSNTVFAVTATGSAPLSYRWYANGAPLANGGRIAGATTATLTISSVQTNDAGPYQVIVTNLYGAATSAVANFTVYGPAQITSHPASVALLGGSNASFSVTAAGSALSYQWFFNGAPVSEGPRLTGSATPSLSVSSVQPGDAGAYSCLVSNFFSSAASRKASLTVLSTLTNSIRFVTLAGTNPTAPYLDWTTAATNIQDAVDASVARDVVVVSNGTYNLGGRAVYTNAINRVVVDKAITVQSVNGPGLTRIQGGANPAVANNLRCVYLTNGAALLGFTLTNGSAATGDPVLAKSGGGAWCESSGAVISNCFLFNNSAGQYGGGAFRGTLANCVLTNNIATFGGGACSNTLLGCTLSKNSAELGNSGGGGGASYSTLSNCLLVGNTCRQFNGGAAYSCTIAGCVVSNNSAGQGGGLFLGRTINSLISSNAALYGGGAFSNSLINCVLKNNAASGIGGGAYGSALASCTVVSNSASTGGGMWGCFVTNSIVYFNGTGGNQTDSRSFVFCCSSPTGSVTNNPLFANLAAGDFHLQSNSPCINSGNNAFVQAPTDFDGNPRIIATVDIGAYEFQPLGRDAFNAWLQQYGLPTDGSAIYADPDHDGFNNLQEWIAGTVPTNGASSLRLLSATPSPAGINIVWQSVSNRAYFVERSANLAAHPPFTTLAIGLAGQDGTTTYTDTTATGGGPYFYRVGVQADSNHLYTPFSVLSYAWLQQFRLPTDGTADFADTDHDGMNNWQEWIAGTNPTNAASFLGMKPIIPGATLPTVSWQSVTGKTYFLQRSTNLATQPPFITIQSNILGQSGTTTFHDLNAGNARAAFYRIGIQQ